jgi:hypothetical protein
VECSEAWHKEVIKSGRLQEEVEEYTTVLQRLRDDLQPQGILEEMLIEKMAVSYWRFRRLLRRERQLHEQQESTFVRRLIDAPAGRHDGDAFADFVLLLLRQPGAAAAKARHIKAASSIQAGH